MRNAYNILREYTIKETLAQGVKGITAANPKSLMADFYDQNDGSWVSINAGTSKNRGVSSVQEHHEAELLVVNHSSKYYRLQLMHHLKCRYMYDW